MQQGGSLDCAGQNSCPVAVPHRYAPDAHHSEFLIGKGILCSNLEL
jgi:hypothetical protein